MNEKYFYHRNLPHWQPEEATFFITYRLAGSLPLDVIDHLRSKYHLQKNAPDNSGKTLLRQQYIDAFENELDKNLNEPYWLKNEKVARIVLDSLHYYNDKQYKLWCASIMSNHVHILLSTLPGSPLLNVILQSHKKFTAVQSNKILQRSGKFWAEESFDTLIRNNRHFFAVANYILQNPVKAGLIKNWKEWNWSYIHPEFEVEFERVNAGWA